MFVTGGIGIARRIGRVHAIDLGRLEQQVRTNLDRAQGGRRIGGEKRIAGAGRKQHHAILLQMADRPAADEVLADFVDLDGTHRSRRAARALDGILHGQGVDHRRQHAHVVAGDPVHARSRQPGPAEDVAPADDHANLHPGIAHLEDLAREAPDDFRVDPVIGFPHQGLTGQLQEDAVMLDR